MSQIQALNQHSYQSFFAGLTKEQIVQAVASLNEYEADQLLHEWDVWARPEQLTPNWNWRTWLILAGRGFGKTRTGAEWVRKQIKTYPYVNIIGATADDARDIMIEGESGILAICPKSERPEYKASKRQIVWPNGAKSLIFTADEPERLRGKQHMKLWCLVGDTKILLANGSEKFIKDIQIGDLVRTRNGAKSVIGFALTCRDSEVYQLETMDGQAIIGTANHPVWVDGQGFIPLASIKTGMSVCVMNVSNGMIKSGIDTKTDILYQLSGCIVKYGNRPTVKFRKAITFTILTVIKLTIGLKTSNCLHIASIVKNIITSISQKFAKLHCNQLLELVSKIVKSGLQEFLGALSAAMTIGKAQKLQVNFVQPNVSKKQEAVLSKATIESANIAPYHISQGNVYKDIVQKNVITALVAKGQNIKRLSGLIALIVKKLLRARGQTQHSAQENVRFLSMQKIAIVKKLAIKADVYDIAVKDDREFFANGILVHNCDELAAWRYPESWDQAMMGLRLGDNPQAVVTTTPRPIKIIRDLYKDQTTHVTRGSTYDNRKNLASGFLEQIIKKYEGTRLGRQELNAEILDDNPNALWQRDRIDELRVVKASGLRRIVVGVDPAVTSNEKSCETGIVVAGLGDNDHAYVLNDLSLVASPDGWAKKAVWAYREYKADRLIGEVNNGGDLIETVIRTVDRFVSYKKVTASRGKAKRAEPIAALYEQGRVHHVGSFPNLEDQMCSYDPLDENADSPDRMDALVWALTELMIKPQKQFLVL